MSKYQLFRNLVGEDYEFLKAKMKLEGFDGNHPVIKDAEGNVLDGHQRLKIAKELGIEPTAVVKKIATEDEKILFAFTENTAGRTITPLEWGLGVLKMLNKLDLVLPPSFTASIMETVTTGGVPSKKSKVPPEGGSYFSVGDLSKKLCVSDKVLRYRLGVALDFLSNADDSTKDAREEGKISDRDAVKASKLAKDDQKEIANSEAPKETLALKGPSKAVTGTTKKTSKKKGDKDAQEPAEGQGEASTSPRASKDKKATEDPSADPSNLNQESYAQLPLTVVDTSDAIHLFGSSKTLGTLIPTKGYHLKLVSDKTPPSNFASNKDEFGF